MFVVIRSVTSVEELTLTA